MRYGVVRVAGKFQLVQGETITALKEAARQLKGSYVSGHSEKAKAEALLAKLNGSK